MPVSESVYFSYVYLRHNDWLVRVVHIYNAAQLELAKDLLKDPVLTVQYRLNVDVVFFSEIDDSIVNAVLDL